MRVLGLDVGERRIGVALSDALGMTAQGVAVLKRRDLHADLEVVCALAAKQGVETIVIGLPLTLQGEHGVQAQRITAFANALRRRVSVPVELVDERLTTVQGERALVAMGASRRKRKQVIDRVAAQLILQHFLDVTRARS